MSEHIINWRQEHEDGNGESYSVAHQGRPLGIFRERGKTYLVIHTTEGDVREVDIKDMVAY